MDKNLLTYLEGYVTERRKNLFRQVLNSRTRHFTVVLENIYQQHNSSAVVRSCDIFGVQDIHVIENTYTSKVSRHVAKGSQKWLSFHQYNNDTNNTSQCFDELKKQGYQIIATTPHNDSCYLHDFDISKKSAFVFGVEKEGVSDYTLENADGYLKIPMVGFTESLNISVAAAIILENLTSRLRKSEINWELSHKEKEVLYEEWIEKSIKNVEKIKKHYLSK
ncbi:RNA methyltransferase [Pseudotenacibaculum sp. MALMAid0570]|mgnify:CR=1 FL=1|uniref:TrmH family RNA methyltransferase n=1 Tax=Pseudotenacibaculum sp. MALMAid0570 TaxID=3143938 RepID=UPI0032E02542